MSKELREMLQALEDKKAQVRALLGEDKVTEAENLMEEVRALQKKVNMQMELEAADDPQPDNGTPVNGRTDAELESEYRRVFMRGLRRQRIGADDRSIISEYNRSIQAAVMHEGGAAGIPLGDSSLIVPQDIETRINELMRSLDDLSQYVRVETVNTLSGSRVLELDGAMTPFQVVAEYGQIQETDNPQFIPVQYQLVKRAGYLPLTSELLADSDQNILQYVTNWIARKHVVTKNTMITTLLGGLNPVPLADLDAVKNVLNVTLDPAISQSATILTNQDGYHWLDTQVDGNGRYLLVDDITQPGRKLLFGKPVAVISNRYLPSVVGPPAQAPIVIGNGQQLAVLFTRGKYELGATTEGGDAWRRDTTELRTITRDDLVLWDTNAAVYGQLAI
ncbi:MAG: phage major capsid protein [Firmicutes bacterium]|nr:phage major capsid protein [Bacillota bacterium]